MSLLKHFKIPAFALVLLILATLACGGEETAEKVGEVTDEQSAAPTSSTEQSELEEVAAGAEAELPDTPIPAEEPTVEPPSNYQVGDIISIGDTVMVVLGWDSPAGDEFNRPDEGNMFVVIDLLLVNQGTATDSISSLLQMSLKDDTAQQYDLDLSASMAANASGPDGEISAGERVRGSVGFQVPEDAQGIVFVFDADLFGSGKVFVELGPEPVAVDPPAELVGETTQDMFSVGDIVEIGNMKLTVNEVSFPPGDDFNRPDEGNQFIVVDVTFENTSAEAQPLSSLLQISLKDDTGQGYDLDLGATMAADGSTPDGEMAPGETLRGQVGFQVPVDAQGLVFVFDADVYGFGKVFVALSGE